MEGACGGAGSARRAACGRRRATYPAEVSEDDGRWPRGVYGVGHEPDPRFSLANERTFLAWIRTTLAFLAGAAAVDALALPMPREAQQAISVVLALAGLACAWQAWTGWRRAERAMRLGEPLPHSRVNLPLVMALGAVALALVVLSVVRG